MGGRASQYIKDGFTFDMGPTWYWMPDVFESFFSDFDKKPADYYKLIKLNPAYKVVFDNEAILIGDSLDTIAATFDQIESGAGDALKTFLTDAENNYNLAIKNLVYKPGQSIFELVTLATVQKLHLFFSTISKLVRKKFKNEKLRQILEFPVLFLGAKAENTPAFYNFMNWADFGLGTYYPEGGMYKVVEGLETLAVSLGVEIHCNADVQKMSVTGDKITSITVNGTQIETDLVLSGADYYHTETLFESDYRNYSENYWQKKTFAPSSLLYYVALDEKIPNVEHHTLFFDVDFSNHASAIYDEAKWPKKPLFYASFPSKTDKTICPPNKEMAIFLIPIAPDLKEDLDTYTHYYDILADRLLRHTGYDLKKNTLFYRTFSVKDFKEVYNSYKGNAYGLANTLLQTAVLRPSLKSKKVKNLYFTGQLSVPGPGVPPALISGKLAAGLIKKYHP